jgi:hypothetical protein
MGWSMHMQINTGYAHNPTSFAPNALAGSELKELCQRAALLVFHDKRLGNEGLPVEEGYIIQR